MLSLCLKKDDDRMSPVRLAIVPPISAQISCVEGPQAPRVSIAIGTKGYRPEETSWLYLSRFFSSAKTAADPAASDGARIGRAGAYALVKNVVAPALPRHGNRLKCTTLYVISI